MITLSKSVPVQFWLNGKPVYNQQEQFEVMTEHFHQLWLDTDNVVLQFVTVDDVPLYLRINDADGNEIEELPMTKVAVEQAFLHSISFKFSDYGITGVVSFKALRRTEIAGDLVDPIEIVSGDATFTANTYDITGNVNELMEVASGTITFEPFTPTLTAHSVQLSNTFSSICGEITTIVYSADSILMEGSLVYEDELGSTVLVGFDYIVPADGVVYSFTFGIIGGVQGFCVAP